jgi:hypothetical protein
MLNIGAYFIYKGQIFTAVIIYFIADICWCIMSYQRGDSIGLFLIILGMLFGLGASLKMGTGKMRKHLNIL